MFVIIKTFKDMLILIKFSSGVLDHLKVIRPSSALD